MEALFLKSASEKEKIHQVENTQNRENKADHELPAIEERPIFINQG